MEIVLIAEAKIGMEQMVDCMEVQEAEAEQERMGLRTQAEAETGRMVQ